MNNKKSIFFLHGKCPVIRATSGDQITEINIIKCLSLYYHVYYNNQIFKPTEKNFV